MAYSYVLLTGDGSNTTFAFNFQYIDKSHVHVKVNDVETPFTWLTSGTISIVPAPTGKVEIRRITPKTTPPVNFADGSVLKESDLDLLAAFVLYCVQESQDNADLALEQSQLGSQLYKVYQGAKANPPSVRNDGTALQIGDLYFNTTLSALQVYGALGWQDAGTTLNGIITTPENNIPIYATAGQTVFPVPEGYTPGQGFVTVNGVDVYAPDVDISDGANIVFASPLNALDEVYYAFFTAVEIVEGGGGGPTTATNVSFVPSGSLESTNVQLALLELMNEMPQPSNDLPQPPGLAASAGTSLQYARADHVHVNLGGGGGGDPGENGYSNGLVYAYKRSLTSPVGSPGDVTVTMSSGLITTPSGDSLASGWTKTIPSGTDPLWVTVASASSNTATDTIAGTEWSAPVILAQNGNDGLKVATVYIYKRAVTNLAPALPTATCTYDFTTTSLTGLNNGWSTTIPSSSGGAYLFASTATAASTSNTDNIAAGEWAAVQLMAQNGTDGVNGSNGSTGATGQRGTVAIAVSTSGSTWNNSTANSGLVAAGYGSPVNRDIVTLYNTGANYSETRYYDSGSWIALTAYLNGNMLVTGTLSANKISGGTLSGVNILFGTGFTPSSKAFEITSGGAVWVDNLFGGVAQMNNSHYTSSNSLQAVTYGNVEAVVGTAVNTNSGAGAHGVRGKNFFNGASGLVGAANGYDFYADGSGTNYGPFTGAHDALLQKGAEITPGDIVVDYQCIVRNNLSNTLFEVKSSTQENQKGAVGVLVNRGPLSRQFIPAGFPKVYEDLGDGTTVSHLADPEGYQEIMETYDLCSINALGEGQINVVGMGGNIEAGDLIVCSAVPGKGMKQVDDVVRGYTVAKAREAVTFSGPNEVKQIACIYLCG